MKKLIVLPFLFVTTLAYAQARPTDKFAWTQPDATAIIAQSYRYELELDNVVQTVPLVVTCVNDGVATQCQSPIPAITPSSHSVRIRAVDISNTAPFVGDWSEPFTFTMKATPSKPTSIHIISGN